MSPRTPTCRLNKATGQAVVTLGGRDVYLGKHGSPESRAEYDRVVAEFLASGRRAPVSSAAHALSINELIVAYVRWADGYYVKDGHTTKEAITIRLALRPLRRLYGITNGVDFGPLALKTVREAYIADDLCRNEVNRRTRIVVRCFKWAVENELVSPSIHHGLRAVSGLRKGRTEARESKPVKPVPDAAVDAIKPHVSRQVTGSATFPSQTLLASREIAMIRFNTERPASLTRRTGYFIGLSFTPFERRQARRRGKEDWIDDDQLVAAIPDLAGFRT
jgi:hypothetical protein